MQRLLILAIAGAQTFSLCLILSAAQIPAAFQNPIVGHVFDTESHTIRPIVGTLQNSRVSVPLALPFSIREVAFLSDQRHAVITSMESSEAFVLDLYTLTYRPISGASSPASSIVTSTDSSAAALSYPATEQIAVVRGLPSNPLVAATIPLPMKNRPLRKQAIATNGDALLLVQSSTENDQVYSWSAEGGVRFVMAAAQVSAISIIGDDAILADSGTDEIFLIRNIRGEAVPSLVANADDGVSQPSGISISSRNEIYLGNAGSGMILVMDAAGHTLRRISCFCKLTGMSPLANDALRLTEQLHRPIITLDRESSDRILFIPALLTEGKQVTSP